MSVCYDLKTCNIPLSSSPFSKSKVFLTITTDEYVFNVTMKNSYGPRGELESVIIIFGDRGKRGKTDECIEIVVRLNAGDERIATYGLEKVASLERVTYDSLCVASGKMRKGGGTMHMTLTAIGFVRSLFPNVERFSYTDATHINCHGSQVPLASLHLAQHGITWYQRFLHSRLENESLRSKFDSGVQDLANKDLKRSVSFSDFAQGCGMNDDTIKQVASIYERAGTFMEFFSQVREYANANDINPCVIMSPWTDQFISKVFGPGTLFQKWEFEAQAPSTPQMKIESSSEPEVRIEGGGSTYCGLKKFLQTTIPIEDVW